MLLESPYGWPLILAAAALIAVTLRWGWRGQWRRAWQLVLGAVGVAILLAVWAMAGGGEAPVETLLPFILIASAAGLLFAAAAAALILSAFAITAKVTDQDPQD